jgi:hypothetical protein
MPGLDPGIHDLKGRANGRLSRSQAASVSARSVSKCSGDLGVRSGRAAAMNAGIPMASHDASEHGKLIASAAKAALAPLGCVRKGRSRVWFADQRFWAIWIEFQPSGWSKGSYLNVGTRYFWRSGRGLAFSYRPVDFIPFESAEQFTPLIETIAGIAAREVVALRERFRTPSDVLRHLQSSPLRDGWPVYDAAIASWLVGDVEQSRALFQRIAAWPTCGYDWEKRLKASSAVLAAQLDRHPAFRSAILDIIQRQRTRIGLAEDRGCLDDAADHTSAR